IFPGCPGFVAKWPLFVGVGLHFFERGAVPDGHSVGNIYHQAALVLQLGSYQPPSTLLISTLEPIRPMLDPKLVRSEPQTVAAALAKRGFSLDIDYLQSLESQRRDAQEKTQHLQAERNAYAKSMGKEIAAAKARGEDIESLKAKGEELKNACHQAESELSA